jgi:hypothetical protein
MTPKSPQLNCFAIDILTIPASSCERERLSSKIGDLLEPKRRAFGSELLAAFQLIRSWTRVGFYDTKYSSSDNNSDSNIEDDDLAREFAIQNWLEED